MFEPITVGGVMEDLDREALEVLLRDAPRKVYPKNAIVISAGDVSDGLYMIEYGRVRVLISDDEGREVILTSLAAGDYFGEMALIDNEERSATIATTEETCFRIVSKQTFQQALADHPNIAYQVLVGLVKRLREADRKIESLALFDVYGRLARTLLQLAKEENGRLVIENKPTHQDLANMIGASREMVTRLLRDLTRGNYISVEQDRFVLNEKLPNRW